MKQVKDFFKKYFITGLLVIIPVWATFYVLRAILGWIDVGGLRTPIYLADLDPAKLKKAAAAKDTYYYDDVTVDPRYEELGPPPEQRKTG